MTRHERSNRRDLPGRHASGSLPEPANEDESMDRLLHFAGPRRGMSEDAVARLEEAARVVWQEKVHSHLARRRRRFRQVLAAAAALALGAGLVFWLAPFARPAADAGAIVATVEARSGRVTGGSGSALAVGERLEAGRAVETAPDTRAALRLASGASIRLDVGTRLELASARQLRLARGAVYVDTEGRAASLAVETRYGVARDVGTQFEVRLGDDLVRIQVREGEVRFDTAAESHPAAAGTVLTVGGDGAVERGVLEGFAPEWSWVSETRPPFEIEGRTVRQVLEWFSRETGLTVRFNGQVGERIGSVITAGSVEGLSPVEILEAVLPGAGLAFRVDEGTVVVSRLTP